MYIKKITQCLLAMSALALCTFIPGPALADTTTQETMTSTSTNTSNDQATAPQVVTVEKPVVLNNKEKIVEKQVIVEKSRQRSAAPARRRVAIARPRHPRRMAMMSSRSSNVIEKTIERTTEKPVVLEKPVMVDRPVERVIEKPVYIDRPVPVEVEKPVVIEKETEVQSAPPPAPTVIEQKDSHHLFNLKLF